MSLKKFGPNDVIVNTMRAHPSCEFLVYDGKVYYNNIPQMSGANTDNILCTTGSGYVSLYEKNIDRAFTNTDRIIGPSGPGLSSYTASVESAMADSEPNKFVLDTGRIYPFLIKDSSMQTFKTMRDDIYSSFMVGDIISGSTGSAYEIVYPLPNKPVFLGGGMGTPKRYQYPMSASITREFMTGAAGIARRGAGQRQTCYDLTPGGHIIPASSFKCTPYHRHFWALKNRLDFYGILSEHYRVSSSYGDKNLQKVNLISIPEIFFGSGIKPGTVSLKWYYTGSLAGELRDTKRNGELIEVSGSSVSSVAGVVLYDEGFILLTGSWALNDESLVLAPGAAADNPKWIYFAVGANDGANQTTIGHSNFNKIAFNLSFKGASDTQVVTVFAHAKRGEANYSNNPTYLQYGQTLLQATSSHVYEENPNRIIANTVSSSYSGYSASFKRQVYISRIGIYDDNKNLIGVATLSNPILKEEDQDYSFKIRLDI
jgi:hypothetical protein